MEAVITGNWLEGDIACLQIRVDEGTAEKPDHHEYTGRVLLFDAQGNPKDDATLTSELIEAAKLVRENEKPKPIAPVIAPPLPSLSGTITL